MTGSSPLAIEGLVKRFGDVAAVAGVSLELSPGELLAIVGPSGCGKSTLLRTVAGLVDADAGRVSLAGVLVDDGSVRVPPERRGVGLVFQDHALFPHLTVQENVAFGIRGEAGARSAERVDEMLELVSLPGYGGRYPHELSGGEKQRVSLARALAPRPALMLFDEPFASIDHNLRVRLRADVVAALRATGTPSLFVTHDQSEALAIGDRIAVMRRGEIVQIDTPPEVFHRPVDRFVGGFMGDASFLPIGQAATGLGTVLGPVEPAARPSGEPAVRSEVAMVRPDDLLFTAMVDGADRVLAVEYRGSDWLLTVRLGDGSKVKVTASHLDSPVLGTEGTVSLVPGHRQLAIPDDLPARSGEQRCGD